MITCQTKVKVKKLFRALNLYRRRTAHSFLPTSFRGNASETSGWFVRQYATKTEEVKERFNTKFEEINEKYIRNFSIVAHVDHGKSTLADRLLEFTGTLKIKAGDNQVLDRLQVEKDRGITVKAQTASLLYKLKDKEYLLNLIDTPGHVDFSSEVARSVSVCQGVILLVDANQGVQAQTVANYYLAFSKGLTIIPVLNKVDLPHANPQRVEKELDSLFGFKPSEILRVSAKLGTGVEELLSAVIERIPAPKVDRTAPLRALIFDSWFDKFKGAIALVYLQDGEVKVGDLICSGFSKKEYTVKHVGVVRPFQEETNKLLAGQVGYLICLMRTTKEAFVGDTLYLKSKPVEALESFTPPKPMVFAGIYPMDQSELPSVRVALDKLTLNDPAVTVVKDTSPALGHGWRLGFLGLLHMEVFNQRLQQEHNADCVVAAPSVTYKVKVCSKRAIQKFGGRDVLISNPVDWPEPTDIVQAEEPLVLGTIVVPATYIGAVYSLCVEKRGRQKSTNTLDGSRVMVQFILPLSEIIVDFHDSLKSLSKGFASFDYEEYGYEVAPLVKMLILLNGVPVEELSTIVHTSKILTVGQKMCKKLSELVPRQLFPIAVQAVVGTKVYARETIKAFRKDVTSKLYGGDVSRKLKLLKNQAEGKKRMKALGNVQVPRETFMDFLKQ